MTDESTQELQRVAVMFPRLFLWVIGILMSALTLLGGAVVSNLYSTTLDTTKKLDAHEPKLSDHEVRLRVLEAAMKEMAVKTSETNVDVKEIRRLLEDSMRRSVR